MAESLILKCSWCGQETNFTTSSKVKLNIEKHRSAYDVNVRSTYAYDVNVRSTYASHTIGRGLQTFCGVMDLPPTITKSPYSRMTKAISSNTVIKAEAAKEAANKLANICLDEDPENTVISDGVIVTNVSVSVDETWQRKGHNSKTGVVFVISILTGEVMDYEVKTLYCHECVAHKNDDKTTLRYQQWMENHSCDINHSGSSDSMETAAAVEMFSRSVGKQNLKYTTFVEDGDSSCFAHVKEPCFNKYGQGYIVVKEECDGHIQKRIGRALREYKRKHTGIKLSDNKSVGGPKRLTDLMIDRIQNYYGQAIRNNNDLEYLGNFSSCYKR